MEKSPPPSLDMAGGTQQKAKAPPFRAAIHSVQKATAKPWKRPDHRPVPPKVYRVDPRGFRQLVQKLTGAPQPTPRPLRNTARPPPALDLAPRTLLPPPQPIFDNNNNYFLTESVRPMEQKAVSGYQSPTGLAGLFSPSLLSWCSFPLLSPGSMATLEQSSGTVL